MMNIGLKLINILLTNIINTLDNIAIHIINTNHIISTLLFECADNLEYNLTLTQTNNTKPK